MIQMAFKFGLLGSTTEL